MASSPKVSRVDSIHIYSDAQGRRPLHCNTPHHDGLIQNSLRMAVREDLRKIRALVGVKYSHVFNPHDRYDISVRKDKVILTPQRTVSGQGEPIVIPRRQLERLNIDHHANSTLKQANDIWKGHIRSHQTLPKLRPSDRQELLGSRVSLTTPSQARTKKTPASATPSSPAVRTARKADDRVKHLLKSAAVQARGSVQAELQRGAKFLGDSVIGLEDHESRLKELSTQVEGLLDQIQDYNLTDALDQDCQDLVKLANAISQHEADLRARQAAADEAAVMVRDSATSPRSSGVVSHDPEQQTLSRGAQERMDILTGPSGLALSPTTLFSLYGTKRPSELETDSLSDEPTSFNVSPVNQPTETELREQMASQAAELEQAQQHAAELETELAALRQQLPAELPALQKTYQVATTQTELLDEQAKKEKQELQTALEAATALNQNLNGKLSAALDANRKMGAMQVELSDLDDAAEPSPLSPMSPFAKTKANVRRRMQELEGPLSKKRLSGLASQAQKLGATQAQAQQQRQRAAQAQSRMQELEDENRSLTDQLKLAEEQLLQAKQQVEQLNAALEQSKQAIAPSAQDEHPAIAPTASTEVDDLRQQNRELLATLAALQSQASHSRTAADALKRGLSQSPQHASPRHQAAAELAEDDSEALRKSVALLTAQLAHSQTEKELAALQHAQAFALAKMDAESERDGLQFENQQLKAALQAEMLKAADDDVENATSVDDLGDEDALDETDGVPYYKTLLWQRDQRIQELEAKLAALLEKMAQAREGLLPQIQGFRERWAAELQRLLSGKSADGSIPASNVEEFLTRLQKEFAELEEARQALFADNVVLKRQLDEARKEIARLRALLGLADKGSDVALDRLQHRRSLSNPLPSRTPAEPLRSRLQQASDDKEPVAAVSSEPVADAHVEAPQQQQPREIRLIQIRSPYEAARKLVHEANLDAKIASTPILIDIMAGHILPLIQFKHMGYKDRDVLKAALDVLSALIDHPESHQHPELIHNLAVYIANCHTAFRANDSTLLKLRAWMLAEAAKGLKPSPQQLQIEELLLLTLAPRNTFNLYGDIASPLQRVRSIADQNKEGLAQRLAKTFDPKTPGLPPTFIPIWENSDNLARIEAALAEDVATELDRPLILLTENTINHGLYTLTGLYPSANSALELLRTCLRWNSMKENISFPLAIRQALHLNEDAMLDMFKLLFYYAVELSEPSKRKQLLAELPSLLEGNKKEASHRIHSRLQVLSQTNPNFLSRIDDANLPRFARKEGEIAFQVAVQTSGPVQEVRKEAAVEEATQADAPPSDPVEEPAQQPLARRTVQQMDVRSPVEVAKGLLREITLLSSGDVAHIMAGNVDDLSMAPDEQLLIDAEFILGKLLENPASHDHPALIYNLATFIVNWNRDFKGKPIYGALREWMLIEASTKKRCDLLEGAALQKEELLLLALANRIVPELYGDIADPLEQVQVMNHRRNRNLGGGSLEWARGLIKRKDPVHPNEVADAARLRAILQKREAGAPKLEYPTFRANDVRKGSNATLEEQLAGLPNRYTFIQGLRDSAKTWLATEASRETIIEEAITEFLDANNLARNLAAQKQVETAGLEPRFRTQWEDTAPIFERIGREFAAARAENRPLTDETRRDLLDLTSQVLSERVALVTGLPTTGDTPVHLLEYVQEHGQFPVAILQGLLLASNHAQLDMAKLLYYYNILQNEPNPDKPEFSKIAAIEQLRWLTEGDPLAGADRMVKLLQALKGHPKFLGSPLSCQQAVWFENLFKLMSRKDGIPDAMHAPTGSGKSALTLFGIEFIKSIYPELAEKRVIFYSTSPSKKPGIESRDILAELEDGCHVIEVDTDEEIDEIVVIVDEPHTLPVGARFIIRGPGRMKEIFPLKITATPNEMPKRYMVRKATDAYSEQFAAAKQRLLDERHRLVSMHADMDREARKDAIKAEAGKLLRSLQQPSEKPGPFSYRDSRFCRYIPQPLLATRYIKSEDQTPDEVHDPAGNRRTAEDGHFIKAEKALVAALGNVVLYPTNTESLLQVLTPYREMFENDVLNNPHESREHTLSFKTLPQNASDHSEIAVHEDLKRRATNFLAGLKRLEALVSGKPFMGDARFNRLADQGDRVETSFQKLVKRMNGWSVKAQAEREASAYYTQMEEDRNARFGDMHFETRDFQSFEPAAAGRMIAEEISRTIGQIQLAQVILPGVSFTPNGLSVLVDSIQLELMQKGIGVDKPIYFVCRNVADGADYVIAYDNSDEEVMNVFPLEELDQHTPGLIVMMYDHRLKQGHDLGAVSTAGRDHDIHQYIFFNIGDKGVNPVATCNAVDAHQMFGRKRGLSALKPYVFAHQSQADFVKAMNGNLQAKQRDQVIADFAPRIARKLIEAHVVAKYPRLTLPSTEDMEAGKDDAPSLFRQHKNDIFTKQGDRGAGEHDLPHVDQLTAMVADYLRTGERGRVLDAMMNQMGEAMQNIPTQMQQGIDAVVHQGEQYGSENLWRAQEAFASDRILIEDYFDRNFARDPVEQAEAPAEATVSAHAAENSVAATEPVPATETPVDVAVSETVPERVIQSALKGSRKTTPSLRRTRFAVGVTSPQGLQTSMSVQSQQPRLRVSKQGKARTLSLVAPAKKTKTVLEPVDSLIGVRVFRKNPTSRDATAPVGSESTDRQAVKSLRASVIPRSRPRPTAATVPARSAVLPIQQPLTAEEQANVDAAVASYLEVEDEMIQQRRKGQLQASQPATA